MRLFQRIKIIGQQRRILWNITIKELKGKYVGSFLGIFWSLLTPLLITAVITFVFTQIIHVDIERFPLFCLAGFIPWFFFSFSLSEVTNSLLQKGQLYRQCNFPLEFIPFASILANFLNFLFGFIFLIILFVFFNVRIVSYIPFLIPVMLGQLFFTLGLGMIFCCLNVFFRDTTYLLGVVLLFWLWMTPIFYSLEMIPQAYREIFRLNPMALYIDLYRTILVRGMFPSLKLLLTMILVGLVTFIVGYIVFLKNKNKLIKLI